MKSIDPRSKLIWAIGGIITIFLTKTIFTQLLITISIFTCIMFFRVSIKSVFNSVKYLLILLPITFSMHLIFSTGLSEILSFNNIVVYINPIMFTLRLANFIIFMSFIVKWLTAIELLDSIYLVIKPLSRLRFPIDDIFQIIFISIRFFPILKEEYFKLKEGRKNFLKETEVSVKQRTKKIKEILIPLMIFSFRKAEILADAMTIRGYGRNVERTYFTRLKFTKSDRVFSFCSLLFFTIIFISL